MTRFFMFALLCLVLFGAGWWVGRSTLPTPPVEYVYNTKVDTTQIVKYKTKAEIKVDTLTLTNPINDSLKSELSSQQDTIAFLKQHLSNFIKQSEAKLTAEHDTSVNLDGAKFDQYTEYSFGNDDFTFNYYNIMVPKEKIIEYRRRWIDYVNVSAGVTTSLNWYASLSYKWFSFGYVNNTFMLGANLNLGYALDKLEGMR